VGMPSDLAFGEVLKGDDQVAMRGYMYALVLRLLRAWGRRGDMKPSLLVKDLFL